MSTRGDRVRQAYARATSLQARQQIAADAAQRILIDVTAKNRAALGREPLHRTMVDGREGATLESVNPDGGHIVFRFGLVRDVLAWIDAQLVTHSPVLSGRYSKAHAWLADGQSFELGQEPPAAKVFTVLSTVPYARKIERGESKQAPNGVYEVVAVLAQRRFGNIASIGFEYRSPLLDYAPGGANRESRAALRNQPERLAAIRLERSTRVPAVTVTVE